MVDMDAGMGFSGQLHVINDPATGASGVIAIHSTALGPAAGGCRLWSYSSDGELMEDAVRLARGMSYKNALAGLPLGGGKAVLRRPDGDFDRAGLFRVFADAVEELGGSYVTAEDVGTTVGDMELVRQRTRFVAGLEAVGGQAGGDPSPWTALGVFESMKVAAQLVLGGDLKGMIVAVQGVGNVGARLCHLLAQAGARLIVADVDPRRAQGVAEAVGARIVDIGDILGVEADIFAPCALGAVLNERSIPLLKAKIICGGANNQLATDGDGERLFERGITYAPDYVVNAGGIINVAAEYLGESTQEVQRRVLSIGPRVETILKQAIIERLPANLVADELAGDIIAQAHKRAA
jgi:leucine dehydrogenase